MRIKLITILCATWDGLCNWKSRAALCHLSYNHLSFNDLSYNNCPANHLSYRIKKNIICPTNHLSYIPKALPLGLKLGFNTNCQSPQALCLNDCFFLKQTKSLFRPTSTCQILIKFSFLESLWHKETNCTSFAKKNCKFLQTTCQRKFSHF